MSHLEDLLLYRVSVVALLSDCVLELAFKDKVEEAALKLSLGHFDYQWDVDCCVDVCVECIIDVLEAAQGPNQSGTVFVQIGDKVEC